MFKNHTKNEISVLAHEISYHNKAITSVVIAAIAATGAIAFNSTHINSNSSSAATCADATCNTSFEVNVDDSLAVTLTTPETGATGNVGDFLRNTVNLEVDSNVSNGFTASMYSSADNASATKTDLTHDTLGDSYTISTLQNSTTRGSFPTDSWGYSLKTSPDTTTYGETDAGNNSSYYYPLTASDTSPITVMSASAGTKTSSQSIYFGAKASANKPSGTYNNTVVISVVTGTIDSTTNPITPTNPATPGMDTPNNNTATYTGNTGTGATTGTGVSGNAGTTVYTTSSHSGSGAVATTTTTTEVSAGDHTSSYVSPQGVQSTNRTNLNSIEGSSETGTPLPAALAATAAASATTGLVFFILAKRRKDDDEEEE